MSKREFLENYEGGTIYKLEAGSKTFYEWDRYTDIGKLYRQKQSLVSQELAKLKKLIIAEVSGA